MFEIETDKNLIQLEHIRSLWSSVCNDVRNYNATETFDVKNEIEEKFIAFPALFDCSDVPI